MRPGYIGFFLWLWLCQNNVSAQFYESGTEPLSVRWQQINTDHFRVIYPTDAVQDGQRAANALEYIYRAEGKTLKHYPAKIPVVLHNRTVISNGFVSWAPKRSEWFLTPPQDNYAQDWLYQLAVHEYRHVVQIDKLNQGITKAVGFVTGQQAVGAMSSLVPLWFLEGDAVATETALTNAGRGRNPAFEMPLRTIALSGEYQKYDKALFGSYRDHVPNHYELGYQIVSWTREHYGAKTFDTSVDFVARKPYSIIFCPPFRLGIKKETGHYTWQLYQNALSDLTNRWRQQEMRTKYDSITPITKHANRIYTNYRSPHYLNDSTFVALKTSMAQIAQWVKINCEGREQTLHTPGYINSERVSYSNGLLAWTELVQDVRWSNRSYSVVKIFDLHTGKERLLQRRTRYFSPTLSPDGATIAVVDVPVTGICAIVLLDVATGKEKDRLPNPYEAFLQMPSWSKDSKSLLAIASGSKGKSIERIDIATGQFTTVLPPAYNDISCPVDDGKYALFNAYYNGITNIYAVDYHTGKVLQVSSARFGAFDPQPNATGDKLVYAEYSVKGYDLVETYMDTEKWTPVEQLRDHSLKLYESLAQQEGFNLQDSIIPNMQYLIKPFRKWTNLFNVHSWAPLYYDVDVSDVFSTDLYPGAVVFSQDLLGNLTSSAGYSWRGYHAFHAGFTYKGIYPIIDFKIEHGGDIALLKPSKNDLPAFEPKNRNTNVSVRSYVPFTLTRNRWITGVVPQIRLLYDNHYLYSQITDSYQYGLWRISYGIQIYRYLKSSIRDLAPRLGVVAQGIFQHTPWNNEQLGYIYYIQGRVYLPGLARHHSLLLTGAWQQQKTNYFMFNSSLSFPRGYFRDRTEKLSIGKIDYGLPLCYPDWSLYRLLYLKRLRTNLFCDLAQNQYRISRDKWQKNNMFSTGVDLIADVNLLQIYFPMNLGIRTVYIPDTKEIQQELLFSVTF